MGRFIKPGVFELDVYDEETGELKCLHGVHEANEKCDDSCPLHNPSDHPLKDAPQDWQPKIGMIRKCECGIWHPDFDSQKMRRRYIPELQAQIDGMPKEDIWQKESLKRKLLQSQEGLQKAHGHICCAKRCCVSKDTAKSSLNQNPLQRD